MDILGAVESHFRNEMDVSAFEINVCVKDQSKENSFQRLVNAIQRYNKARSNFEVVQNLKSQLYTANMPDAQSPPTPEQVNES